MGDKGSKDKGKREKQKKAQLSPKEKKKLKYLLQNLLIRFHQFSQILKEKVLKLKF